MLKQNETRSIKIEDIDDKNRDEILRLRNYIMQLEKKFKEEESNSNGK